MPTVFITGTNRGIGLEFVRQYAGDGWRVLAACRNPELANQPLRALGGDVRPIGMDVTDLASVEAVAREDDAPIDLLINSAGIMGQTGDGPGQIDYAEWTRVLDVNTMGPVRVLDALADRIAASERRLAVTITSGMGSLTDAGSGMALMYRTSKAAVNMAMRARAFQLKPRGITVAVINPGWVKTDMGGPNATLTVEASVTAMRAVLDGLTPAQSGSFLNYTGAAYPW
jgi:NAD(P)-dependent dehydrogenase (short-subunit alcohol dehydrogenase family)